MKIWRHIKGFVGCKFLVVRRDGTVPHWPYFVLGARDPASATALRAYAKSYKLNSQGRHAFDEEMYLSILHLAVEFEDYRVKHGDGDASAPPHRKDDPVVIAAMRGEDSVISVRCDKGDAAKPDPTEALAALKAWFGLEDAANTATLYNAAGELFGSKFDPFEYDSVG